jgi:hypothetical protein
MISAFHLTPWFCSVSLSLSAIFQLCWTTSRDEVWRSPDLVKAILADLPKMISHQKSLEIHLENIWLFNIAMENGPFIDDFPIKVVFVFFGGP